MAGATSQIHELIAGHAARAPDSIALIHGKAQWSYRELHEKLLAFAAGAVRSSIEAGDRIGVFLPKQLETVATLFGTSAAGGTFVPINPVLKAAQVRHICDDCEVQILVTAKQRWAALADELADSGNLRLVVLVDDDEPGDHGGIAVVPWAGFLQGSAQPGHRRIDRDMAAILYTSGSTGKPKGVVLSHRNLIAGGESVSTYLENTPQDRLLAVLPLSFDAGLSQLTTAFNVGASVVLMDYLLPRDVLKAVARHAVTGLAAVPPLWNQLVQLDWPDEARQTLRYITNTGGAMPPQTTEKLRQLLPDTDIFLMYGLTEAFRSTYLPPSEVDRIPESIGRAIPNAEIHVINEQGEECAPGEPGELVHRGNLVALGYWNNPEKTVERFKPAPLQPAGIPTEELAVWSGDKVMRDEDGYLYFVARQDEMIKTSGYRVSPTEIEEVAYGSGLVTSAAALGIPHPMLGQAILLAVTPAEPDAAVDEPLAQAYRKELPGFMQPMKIIVRQELPQNQNGKLDRRALAEEYRELFQEEGTGE